MGSLFGPVIGAFLLVFITQVVLGQLLDFHLFATGLLLVVLVLGAPGGILGLRKIRARPRSLVAPAE
jgi:branched-chain amino acid transport system permease protein